MVKFKKPPKKPGWYVAWFCGVTLNFPNKGLNYERNVFYWDGYNWLNIDGDSILFLDYEFRNDRWSYLPKDHPMRGKPAPQKV